MTIKNHPNAGKLLSSLRNTGYDSTYTAIEDLLDNSIDAGAKDINVSIRSLNGDTFITLTDNGSGMDMETLDQALKLGSATQKDESSDLGKFGMGLCTASISMAKRLEVITKQKSGSYLYSAQDLDVIVEKDEFIKELREASEEDILFFKQCLKEDHGTIIVLSKTDRLTNINPTALAKNLAVDMARIYRKFLAAGIVISVNGKKLLPLDPLMLDITETKIYSDEEYEIPCANGTEKIRVKLVLLPDVNQSLAAEMKMNIRSQGFYIIRNNREIANGETLNVFSKHNDFNRLRIELSFTSNLDNEMGVRFTKNGVFPNQLVNDFLKQEIGGQISSIRKMLLKEQKSSNTEVVNHNESAEAIARKSKLLITPDSIIETRKPKTETSNQTEATEESSTRTRTPKETKLSSSVSGARFETLSMGKEGSYFDCYQEGKVIVIQLNVDHPFYKKMIFSHKDKKEVIAGIDYHLYALASAELKTTNDDNTELMATNRAIVSSNLRILFS